MVPLPRYSDTCPLPFSPSQLSSWWSPSVMSRGGDACPDSTLPPTPLLLHHTGALPPVRPLSLGWYRSHPPGREELAQPQRPETPGLWPCLLRSGTPHALGLQGTEQPTPAYVTPAVVTQLLFSDLWWPRNCSRVLSTLQAPTLWSASAELPCVQPYAIKNNIIFHPCQISSTPGSCHPELPFLAMRTVGRSFSW